MLVAWTLLLVGFWLGARRADAGPVTFLLTSIDEVARAPWAALALLCFYLLRPLLLVPITVLNLATGLVLGPVQGLPFAMAGTLLSASVGYGIGRAMGSAEMIERLSSRWRLVRSLRTRSFETVVAGGLMYLHADMVNVPSGLLRVRFPTFLLGILFGNSLTLSTAVLAGASVEEGLADATIRLEPDYLVLAAILFIVSVGLAFVLRRRFQPTG